MLDDLDILYCEGGASGRSWKQQTSGIRVLAVGDGAEISAFKCSFLVKSRTFSSIKNYYVRIACSEVRAACLARCHYLLHYTGA